MLITILSIIGLLIIIYFLFTTYYPSFGGNITKEQQLVYKKSEQFNNGKFTNTKAVPKDLSFSETIKLAYTFFTTKVPNGRPKENLKATKIDSTSISNNKWTISTLLYSNKLYYDFISNDINYLNGIFIKRNFNKFTLRIGMEHSTQEINEIYPSGNGNIFYDRISWALSYLNMSGLLDKPKRGMYKINKNGTDILKAPEKLNEYIEIQIAKREPARLSKKNSQEPLKLDDNSSKLTPQEKLYDSFNNIKLSFEDLILFLII